MGRKRRSKKDKGSKKTLAGERIEILFAQASFFRSDCQHKPRDLVHANRCVFLARAIAMKERVRIPVIYRRLFCRTCYCYFIPSVTQQVRIVDGCVVHRCLVCGAVRRYPIGSKNHKKKRRVE